MFILIKKFIFQKNIDNAKPISQKKLPNSYDEIEILSSDSDEETNKFSKENSKPIIDINKEKCDLVLETNEENNFHFLETLNEFPKTKEHLNVSTVQFAETLEEFPECIESRKNPSKKTPVKRPHEKSVGTQAEFSDRSKVIKKSTPVSPVNFSKTLEFPDCPELFQKTSKKTPVKRSGEKYNETEGEFSGRSKIKKSSGVSPVKLSDNPEIVKSPSKISAECSQEIEQFFLLPNNIDIILLVDKQETCGCVYMYIY